MKDYTDENNNLAPLGLDDAVLDKTESEGDASEEYYSLPSERPSMLWSILSLTVSILSVLLSPFYYLGIPLAAASIVMAILSSRKLGYFDKMSVLGLIIGIFGAVFGIFALALDVSGVLDGLIK